MQNVLWAEGVLARRYFAPGCHRMEPYRSLEGGAPRHLPVTERLADEVLCLPTGTATDGAAIATICALIRSAVLQAAAVTAAARPQA
jgi:dTDP-4-amino-4,6-dideoxygalactose transaminase